MSSMNSGTIRREGQTVELALEEHKGVLVRQGTYDKFVVNEAVPSYGWLEVEGRVCMDIGANIGAVSHHWLRHGATKVVALEPEEHNFKMLQRNAPEAMCLQAGVSADEGEAFIYLSKTGKNPGNTSSMAFRGREKVPAKFLQLEKLLDVHRPEVLKIDCEGAEYDFLLGFELPEYVRQVAMEVHLSKREWRERDSHILVGQFRDWEVVKQPEIGEKNWHTLAGWRR